MTKSQKRPLKVLQVGSGFPNWGGAELHLVNLAEQLQLRGHDVTVSTRPGKFVEAEAQKRNLKTVPITVRRQWDWHDAGTILRLMRRERFDVVHVHWSTDYIVSPWIAKRSGAPVVLMSRHSPYPLKSALGRYLYKSVLFDRIITVSDSVRTTLVEQGMPENQVVTIYHGTDTGAFRHTTILPEQVRADWNIPQDRLLFGMVGRLAQEKGVLVFLEALAKAVGQGVNVAGVLVGDGPQKDELTASPLVQKITEAGGQIVFAGFRTDANNAMNALDCHVLASTWAEPCAAVVQQAMALGKPVIGTDIGGTPEMIARDETGLLVPPSDADALAQAIVKVAAMTNAERAAMGQKGVERAERLFTLRGMTDAIEDLCYTILAAKKSR